MAWDTVTFLVVLIPFFLENLAKNKIEDGFSFVLVDNFREQRNIWKGSAFFYFFFFRTECFRRKFVYHLLKPIFDTNFRLPQPFFGKRIWDMQKVLTILGWSLTVLIFSYHLLNLWTDRFAHVNGKKPLFLVSLVNEITLTSPAFKKSLSGIRCPKVMLYGTIFRTTEHCNVGTYVVTIRNNIATMLQRCVALKVVVANRLV